MQETDGISLVDAISVAIRFNVKFIERAVARPCDEAFPDSRRTAGVEPMRFGIPPVKIAHHRNRAGIGRPYAEDSAGLPLIAGQMRTDLVVNAVMAALIEEVEVVLGEQLGRAANSRGCGGIGHLRRLVYRKTAGFFIGITSQSRPLDSTSVVRHRSRENPAC